MNFEFNWLDFTTTLLGLAYIFLEYKASIWLWLVGFVMQALGVVLYYRKGLYADCAMEFYYIAMTLYGFWNWKRRMTSPAASPVTSEGRGAPIPSNSTTTDSTTAGSSSPTVQGNGPRPLAAGETSSQPVITHFKRSLILPWVAATLAIWAVLWYWLVQIGSTVPVADAFTTALSFVGIWALARKYLEQWLIWIVVDVVTCVLYFYKDIPFKASLYGLYVIIAILGYIRWRRMMHRPSEAAARA